MIGSAGSDEKVAYVSSLGADVAFNYKESDLDKVLGEHGPIDMCVPFRSARSGTDEAR